jgi:hypothetical protein
LIIVIIGLGSLWMLCIGPYRDAMSASTGPDVAELRNIDWIEQIRKRTLGNHHELLAATYYMQAVADEKAFDLGIVHWNMLVFNFIPAQIVGREFKNWLNLSIPDYVNPCYTRYGYIKGTGTTVTGLVDCYSSFWYAGCFKFLVIGYIMRRLLARASSGDLRFQVIYTFMLTQSLHAITHNTQWFLSSFIHMLLFLLPIFSFCQIRRPLELSMTSSPCSYFMGAYVR